MTQRARINTAKLVSILAAALFALLPACSAQTATHKKKAPPKPEPTARCFRSALKMESTTTLT